MKVPIILACWYFYIALFMKNIRLPYLYSELVINEGMSNYQNCVYNTLSAYNYAE